MQRVEFEASSSGSVHGLRLLDGRRVVVKAHRPGTRPDFLAAVQAVQRRLAASGFPCPRPLAGPLALGAGLAVAETLLDDGERADGHDPVVRGAMAASLAGLITRCRDLPVPGALDRHPMVSAPGRLWPAPHDPRVDFDATAAGAEWIDAAGRRALEVLAAAPGPPSSPSTRRPAARRSAPASAGSPGRPWST